MRHNAIISALKIAFSKAYVPKNIRGKVTVKIGENGIELIGKNNLKNVEIAEVNNIVK